MTRMIYCCYSWKPERADHVTAIFVTPPNKEMCINYLCHLGVLQAYQAI